MDQKKNNTHREEFVYILYHLLHHLQVNTFTRLLYKNQALMTKFSIAGGKYFKTGNALFKLHAFIVFWPSIATITKWSYN